MATPLFTAEPLVPGTTMESADILDVGDIVIDVDLNGVSAPKDIEFTLKVHEGTNSPKPLTDGTDRIISWKSRGAGFRKPLKGVDTETAKLYIKVPTGATGNMTVVYNQTVNNFQ